jgi:hypothetical protein
MNDLIRTHVRLMQILKRLHYAQKTRRQRYSQTAQYYQLVSAYR